MQILKRAKGLCDGEIISATESGSNVKEEANRRAAKAGYCEKDGTPKGAGKGDTPRPVNKKKYDENYVKIFGHD